MLVYIVEESRYGFWKFVGDCIMFFVTGGLWAIWIFIREMRRRSRRSIQI